MDNSLFDHSPIVDRTPIHWPGGARGAFYVGLNIEHYAETRCGQYVEPAHGSGTDHGDRREGAGRHQCHCRTGEYPACFRVVRGAPTSRINPNNARPIVAACRRSRMRLPVSCSSSATACSPVSASLRPA